jgi:O-antigen/teichoic acid export membrane protein
MMIKRYEMRVDFFSTKIRLFRYIFRDGLIMCPSSSIGLFRQNSNFIGVRKKEGSV